MNSPQPALVLDNVTKRFDDFTAVSSLSLVVHPGRIFGLLGPNGAGKTTTIRMIVNITKPDSGSVKLFGEEMNSALQDRIGYLPEERGLYKKMKVGDQLRFFGEMKGMSGKDAVRAAEHWLGRMKLGEWKAKKTDELSKGMQQKIQFITTVMHEPDLIVLDEPFSGFDPVNAELLKQIVLELKSQNRAIIFSTHMMEQAEQMCDDICLINRSRKVLGGSLREVKSGFGRHAVALRTQEEDAATTEKTLAASGMVTNVKGAGDYTEVLLAPGADEQALLHQLIHARVRVTRFELVEPSLHDIFITKVSEPA